ncbi:unnamed protein product [Parnassius apollo]|uniref:(apollo) hypothetical protein n=1 Tax=Parnassius apollo TaxID=110799 RepID=A0A8S3X260_PARAO|nr:unnamed protein product [Parnassius apollo]
MGVTGLWRLIEPTGKPVPVETLENKVLAVDISIWLHQMVKGYQDAKGAPLPNAHLIGLFQRLCKLLYFRIKPIFVFDGGFPDLKKETIAKRQDNKSKYNSESERLKRELALLLGKKSAIGSLLGKQISPKKASNLAAVNNEDIFKLPALPQRDEETESESEDEQNSSASTVDLHTVDVESDNFKNLPVKEKYDLLVELKETRKMNSWGKLHTLPKKSDNFSDFQMQRLLKRRKIQECLEETEKEMGDGSMSLNELESLLNEEGIDTKIESLPTRRIASNNTTRFLLINNVKQALADAKKSKELLNKKDEINKESNGMHNADGTANEADDDLQKAIKMSLECVDEANTSAGTSKTDDSWTSFLSDSEYSNSCSENDEYEQPDMSSAKAYIMQYSDFTCKAIDNIISSKYSDHKKKSKGPKVEDILEELKNEKTVIIDNVDLSSEEEINEIKSVEIQDFNINSKVSTASNVSMAISSKTNVANSSNDVIELSTSTEDESKVMLKQSLSSNVIVENEMMDNSTDSEFEEVPETETENTLNKSVVQLTLNMGEAPDDDIFADVFEEKNQKYVSNDDDNENKTKTSDFSDLIIKTECNIVKNPIYDKSDFKSIETSCDNKNHDDMTTQNEISNSSKQLHADKSFEENKNRDESFNDLCDPENSSTSVGDIINVHKAPEKLLSSDQLNSLMSEMQNKEEDLLQEKGRLDRIGRNITEQMTKEAQELLQIFGIPYIVAPMEAEAQCAFLESVNLTDGTITDDSDIWLFGGRTVYKNFFNQKKHVMQFLSERIEKSFNLTREQLILLALLVGSDYTTGVSGVGPVTALEILASFPFNKRQLLNESSKQERYLKIIAGLQEFKKWMRTGRRTDNTTLKKKLKNVQLTDDFPSMRVVQAYLEPNVEKSDEKFTWGKMDITILRDYAKTKFGWSQNKLDEIIKPVLSRLAECKSQRSIQDYFKKKIEFQSLEDQMSKRVKAAVQKMDPLKAGETHEIEDDKQKTMKKRKANKGSLEEFTGPHSLCEPSTSKKKRDADKSELVTQVVKVDEAPEKGFEVIIPKTDRFQEIIPQREKDKQDLLQNKLKAIEIFRKTKIDKKTKRVKKRVNKPKEKAELSESSDEN